MSPDKLANKMKFSSAAQTFGALSHCMRLDCSHGRDTNLDLLNPFQGLQNHIILRYYRSCIYKEQALVAVVTIPKAANSVCQRVNCNQMPGECINPAGSVSHYHLYGSVAFVFHASWTETPVYKYLLHPHVEAVLFVYKLYIYI